MRIRFLFAAFLACSLLIQLTLKVQSRARQADEASKALWNVTIVRASRPARVKVVGEGLSARSGMPPAKHKWLQLHVELMPSKAGDSVSLKNLSIVDESAAYPAQAIAQVEPRPAFSFFEDATKRDIIGRTPAGFGLVDSKGNMTVMVVDAGETRGMVMAMQNREAIGILLLFAVPTTTKKLSFQLENGQRVPIRLVAAN